MAGTYKQWKPLLQRYTKVGYTFALWSVVPPPVRSTFASVTLSGCQLASCEAGRAWRSWAEILGVVLSALPGRTCCLIAQPTRSAWPHAGRRHLNQRENRTQNTSSHTPESRRDSLKTSGYPVPVKVTGRTFRARRRKGRKGAPLRQSASDVRGALVVGVGTDAKRACFRLVFTMLMLRAVLSAIFCSCFPVLAGARASLHQHHDRQLQAQPPGCPDTWELAVGAGDSSGPSEVSSALAEAGDCAAAAVDTASLVVTVQWAGSIQTSQPFLVPSGVELRVVGDGWLSSYNQTSDDDGSGDEVPEADAELLAAISNATANAAAESEQHDAAVFEPSVVGSASGNTSLFVVEAGGALRLSGITLSGAWGGADGGGAIHAVGGEVTGEDVRWRSLSAEGAGGAVFAQHGTNVTLAGLHLFQGCSSSALGGGALFAQNASVSFRDGARVFFEGCAAADDGGGVELSASTLTMSTGSRTRFRGCGAADKGGGLYTKLSAVEVAAGAALEFEGCAAGDVSGAKGGGMCSFESAFSVGAGAAVAFNNNSSPIGDGGGFYGQATPLHVAGGGAALRFDGNRCGDSGGGLALEWLTADEDTACLDLAEGSAAGFEGNGAAEYGGGAYIAGCEVSAAGSDVSFTENTAERAGALYIEEAAVFVSGGMTSFVGNSADRCGSPLLG